MNVTTIIAELIFFLIGLPLFSFQTIAILLAFIDFIAEIANYTSQIK